MLPRRAVAVVAQASGRSLTTSFHPGCCTRLVSSVYYASYGQKRRASGLAEVYTKRKGASSDDKTGRHRSPSLPIPLRTLDPKNLSSEDFVVLHGQVMVVKPVHDLSLPLLHLTYYQQTGYKCDFPKGTQGFFYWHSEPGAPELMAQVRFRITESEDQATFSSGRDLCLPTGVPWSIPLLTMAPQKSYELLQSILLSEGLVTQALLKRAANATTTPRRKGAGPGLHSNFVGRFGEPFGVSLQAEAVKVWITDDSTALSVGIQTPFRLYHSHRPPYEGFALVQFERSTLPEHAGSRTVVLRIAKLIGLRKVDIGPPPPGAPEPKEGELVMQKNRGKFSKNGWSGGEGWIPWSVNVDAADPHLERTQALELLYRKEGLSEPKQEEQGEMGSLEAAPADEKTQWLTGS